MEYNKIIAVTALPGLYELISSKNDGAVVRSLDDKTTRFVSSRIHNFSHLESIEIFIVRDNVNLVDILLAMEKSKTALPDVKDNAAVKKYFESVYPDIDFERVYTSDMKKMVKWFEVLKNNNVEIKLSEPEPEEEVAVVEPPKEKPAKEKPAKEKVAEEKPKKAAVKKKEEAAEEKPKKAAKPVAEKATKAKKEEPKKEAPKKKAAPKKKK